MKRFSLHIYWSFVVIGTMLFCGKSFGDVSSLYDEKAPQFSKLSADEKKLLREYAECYEKLRDAYGNATIAAAKNGDSGDMSRLVYRARDRKNFRLDKFKYDISPVADDKAESLYFITPSNYLISELDEKTSTYVVHHYSQDDQDGANNLTAEPFVNAPYTLHVFLLEVLIFKKQAQVKDFVVEHVRLLPDNLVQIETTQYYPEGQECKGKFIFYRNKCWAIKEGTWGNKTGTMLHSSCEYEDELSENGCPRIKHIASWIDYGTRIADRKDYTITSCDFSPPLLTDFDFQRYVSVGLPKSRGLSTFQIVCICAGFFLILLAIFRRVRKVKNKD
ncbi:MAG: hypothetical protein LBU65_09435 [Planctomycetaceae bacterium]|jgi:hypothetical protein|nr:hypothetical protein [Planctomycetaceae bacterium]